MSLVFKALNSYWCLFDGPCSLLGIIFFSRIYKYVSILPAYPDTMCGEQTQYLSHLGVGGKKTGVKLSLGRQEKGGERVLRFSFYFSLPYSDLIGNKLNSFSEVKPVLPVTVIGD